MSFFEELKRRNVIHFSKGVKRQSGTDRRVGDSSPTARTAQKHTVGNKLPTLREIYEPV